MKYTSKVATFIIINEYGYGEDIKEVCISQITQKNVIVKFHSILLKKKMFHFVEKLLIKNYYWNQYIGYD